MTLPDKIYKPDEIYEKIYINNNTESDTDLEDQTYQQAMETF